MSNQPPTNREEIGGILSRINGLGAVTERLFSRLYTGLSSRSSEDDNARLERLREEKRRADQTLTRVNEEVERLNGILASLPDGIVMQDTEGRVVLFNEAARALLGGQRNFWDSELGTIFNQYADITQLDNELLPLGEPQRVEINNKVLGAQVAAVADSHGQRLGTMIIVRDVTQNALAERLKDEFISSLSHELRTPMAVIKGMSEVMLAHSADETAKGQRLLVTLSRNVDILDRMVTELLDLSELSAGNFTVRQDNVDVEAMIWAVVNGRTPDIKRARLDVAVMMRSSGQMHITGDEQRLRWAFGHLLENALRYTEEDGHIIIMATRDDGGEVTVQVIDTGVGIMPKDLPRIFERFYRGEARTADGRLLDPRGLGQGLFIARAVAEAHGGYLGVQSAPSEGSIFTMVLPLGQS